MAVVATAVLLALLLVLQAPTPAECAAPGSDGSGPSSSGRSGVSSLLASLTQYEVVAIRAPQLDQNHRRSIVLGAQEAQRRARRTLATAAQQQSSFAASREREQQQQQQEREDATPRQFSRRISLSFRTLLGATAETGNAHTLSAADGSAAAAATEPVDFDLHLSKMADLFHPSYSQTRQVWREEKRVHQEEQVQGEQKKKSSTTVARTHALHRSAPCARVPGAACRAR